MKLVIFDIDGTLADIRPRSKRAGGMPPRTKRHLFQMWLDRLQSVAHLLTDPPIPQTVDLLKRLSKQKGLKVEYLTGRSEKYRKATATWLAAKGCPRLPLTMRSNDDWRSAVGYKRQEMKRIIKKHRVQGNEVLVIDDDADGDCSLMYSRLGCLHLKVMP